MSAPPPIRAKLITSALSLSLVLVISTLREIGAARSSSEAAFRIGYVVFGTALAFLGVFRSPQLQLLWGWSLAVAVPVLIGLCIIAYRGTDLICALVATLAALVGGYLLLADTSVRGYREILRSSQDA